MTFNIEGPVLEQCASCVAILRLLPDWFGIEQAILKYEKEIKHLPTFVAKENQRVLGFLSLKQHSPYSAEIYVMAVHPGMHHHGIGRKLVVAAESHARGMKIEYMQVKTLGPSAPDENYAQTRLFYQALGYRPLEELTQIWDQNNPCLILVKRL